MRGTVKKDAARVIVLLILVCIIFKVLLVPMYRQDIKNELPAHAKQLTVRMDTK